MRKHTRIFWMLAALVVVLEVGSLTSRLNAQQTPEGSQAQPSQSTQQPSQSAPTQQEPSQQPSQTAPTQQSPAAQSGSASGAQTFAGTIVKQGDKYVLQDASGKTYDIDHQDIVGQHVGRKVRVTGTLDPDGKTIHIGR